MEDAGFGRVKLLCLYDSQRNIIYAFRMCVLIKCILPVFFSTATANSVAFCPRTFLLAAEKRHAVRLYEEEGGHESPAGFLRQ